MQDGLPAPFVNLIDALDHELSFVQPLLALACFHIGISLAVPSHWLLEPVSDVCFGTFDFVLQIGDLTFCSSLCGIVMTVLDQCDLGGRLGDDAYVGGNASGCSVIHFISPWLVVCGSPGWRSIPPRRHRGGRNVTGQRSLTPACASSSSVAESAGSAGYRSLRSLRNLSQVALALGALGTTMCQTSVKS